MKTKVLQLEWWMTSPATLEECVDPDAEMLPVFNRDGYYLHRGVCWFEVGGKAYKTSATQFRYVLNLLHVWQRYNQRQIEAMRVCLREEVATKQQREALHAWDEFQILRNIRRDGLRTRLRLTAFKATRNEFGREPALLRSVRRPTREELE